MTAPHAKPRQRISPSSVLALHLALWLAFDASAAQGSETSSGCDVVAELACGDGVRWITSAPTLPFSSSKTLTAANKDDWARLWDYFGLPQPLPVVDFTADTVVARVSMASECGAERPSVVVCRNGELELRRPITHCPMSLAYEPRARWVWIMTVPRATLARVTKQGNDDHESHLQCRPEIDAAELVARRRTQRALGGERSWFEALRWHAAAGAVGGYSTSRELLYGAELRTGVRDDIGVGGGGGFLGNLVGLDLRARWLQGTNDAARGQFTLGLWPWMMMSEDWVFHRSFSRQPTFMTLIVPEAGLVFDGGVDGYLYWSFPIMLRGTTHFYRTSPYILGEHLAFELGPGLLWRPTARSRDLTVTVNFSIGLW